MTSMDNSIDERVKEMSGFRRALLRPELGAGIGAVFVFILFLTLAFDSGMFAPAGVLNWSTVAAQFTVIAVGACLLMIAGEFDLSMGSMIGFSGMIIAILSVPLGLPLWLAILLTFVIAMALGALNGWLVVKTGLPSFIVTLAFLFILRGLTIWSAILFTNRTLISGVGEKVPGDPIAWLFGGKILSGLFVWLAERGVIATFTQGSRAGQPVIEGLPMVIVWAIGLVVFGHLLLTRTKFGNWIFASGGDSQAAAYTGVPVRRVKISMFVLTAFCATVLATCQVTEFGTAAADRGLLKEFEAIICVVIGGALLTGGYGSVIGAFLGAIIFGMVQQGLYFANVEGSLFRVFLGSILLIAVILNTYIRRIITGEK
ncbi:monosaccharide ABC transporter membrane protein, CUT2 family [Paracoccus halophilus]|uniref:Xylose transport system permease protein XylH n=2 Tax=Paracoccus halophilus TaxID=376733 RepID=A0A1I0UBK2_9RHOB|nr:ABC transporter permease [Paracoccus halophilus]SFA61414.1 monosaccharide ABC transporter membrane protein, CUT2 family [Paracoccus halophilus]